MPAVGLDRTRLRSTIRSPFNNQETSEVQGKAWGEVVEADARVSRGQNDRCERKEPWLDGVFDSKKPRRGGPRVRVGKVETI